MNLEQIYGLRRLGYRVLRLPAALVTSQPAVALRFVAEALSGASAKRRFGLPTAREALGRIAPIGEDMARINLMKKFQLCSPTYDP